MANKKDRGIWLTRLCCGSPKEIAGAVGCEAKALAQTLRGKIDGELLAFEIEGEEGFNPFGCIFQRDGIFGVGRVIQITRRAADFDLLREDRLVVVIKGEKPLWEKRADSLLDFGCVGMYEAAPERIAGSLELFRSLAIADLMQEAAGARDSDKKNQGCGKGTEGFDEERLHCSIILEPGAIEPSASKFSDSAVVQGRAGMTSVLRKSSPLKRSGSPVALASAYEKQSPKLRPAG